MNADLLTAAEAPESWTLIAQMRPALVRYFTRKCGNTAEAEDLTQDVLVRSLANCEARSYDEAKGYVFRAAINRWRDLKRRALTRGTRVGWDDAAAFARDVELSPERVLGVEQELRCVVEALQELPERTRDVLLLVRLERMKQSDVAQRFAISVSAVEKHLARAVAHLARATSQDFTHGPWHRID
jgi:RNA polymerase sigma factor (sigma-70 family)